MLASYFPNLTYLDIYNKFLFNFNLTNNISNINFKLMSKLKILNVMIGFIIMLIKYFHHQLLN